MHSGIVNASSRTRRQQNMRTDEADTRTEVIQVQRLEPDVEELKIMAVSRNYITKVYA